MQKPDLLVFDLDGTLLDTLNSIATAFNRALEDLDCPTHPIVDYRRIIGDGIRVAAERGLPPDRQSNIEVCIEKFRQYYADNWHEAKPYDGIPELLERLTGQVKLAVLSNKDEHFTRQIVDHALPDVFDVVVGYRKPFRHKPDPASSQWIMKQTNVEPDRSWFIGDTGTDMKTAAACNMTGVGVSWGFRDESELLDNGASFIAPSPKGLAEIFEATA